MSHEPTPGEVDAFLDSTVVGDDPALSAALDASDAAGLPRIAVSAQQGKFLCLLATAMRARRILEIGTLGGYSTIWLAHRAGPDGHVVTLENQPQHAEVARANVVRAGVGDRVEVLVGAALNTLPTLAGEPLRSGVHRRRQGEQPSLPRMGRPFDPYRLSYSGGQRYS